MAKHRSVTSLLLVGAVAGFATLATPPSTASGFTQKGFATAIGDVIPIGHEWITRLSALELLGGDTFIKPDPNDPRKTWTAGKAKNLNLSSATARREADRIRGQKHENPYYAAVYQLVYAAIVGERWVDIGGVNLADAKTGKHDCFDAVAQEPVDIQYDHFMRRYDDRGPHGGIDAAHRSQERFIQYFKTAASAPPGIITVWDGGGASERVVVDRNYFLFGRAVHLFEDSFSPEHTVRTDENNLEKVLEVKSYLCAAGSEMHTHLLDKVFDYTSGDVIWLPGTRLDAGWQSYKASFMKVPALVATEATKDLWAAFIRTMGMPASQREQVAEAEAKGLVDNWLSLDPRGATWYDDVKHREPDKTYYVLAQGQTGPGHTVEQCMQKEIGVPSGKQLDKVHELEQEQRICLYNMEATPGFADAVDPQLRLPYNWQWKTGRTGPWLTPPASWKIPQTPVPPEVKVRIKSVAANEYMTVPSGLASGNWIYCKAGTPTDWIQLDTPQGTLFRAAEAPLFLSYGGGAYGYAMVYNDVKDAAYSLTPAAAGVSIKNTYWKTYLWLEKSTLEPRNSGAGNPKNADAQWLIERVNLVAPAPAAY